MLQGQYFWFFALPVDFFGGIGIGLAFGFAIVGLALDAFGGCLRGEGGTSMISSSTWGWKFYCEISWTGGARWRGTSLIVATRGFFTKSRLSQAGVTDGFLRRRRRCCLASGWKEPAFE
jgi:hypothetical protein